MSEYDPAGRAPSLLIRQPRREVRAVVLVLHGGAQHGQQAVYPWRLAYLRMRPLADAIAGAGADHGVAVWLLRNRVRGWNAPTLDAIQDARWALARIHAAHPDVPIVLVGHSMGARAALSVADDPAVRGVCGCAAWIPREDPIEPVTGLAVLLVHGTADRVTPPAGSYVYGQRADRVASRLARFEVAGERHAMLSKPGIWNRLLRAFTLDVFGFPPVDTELSAAWAKPREQRLRIPI